MPIKTISRRELLKIGAATGAAGLTSSLLAGCGAKGVIPGIPGPTSTCAKLTDIEHVVILIQENRSFDHYFGSYKGVRGFSDASAAFQQPYPNNASSSPAGVLLPFHLDTINAFGACTHDIAHDWIPQHQSWNNGAMDAFATSHVPINGDSASLVMGYYTRADLPYYYAVADAFTLCDNYFCSVMGPTDPNRLYTMAASIDPDGKNGGPLLQTLVANRAAFTGKLTYTTMPEQLETRGISWKVYNAPEQNILKGIYSDNVLPYFKQFQDPSSSIYKKAFGPQFPDRFRGRCRIRKPAAGFLAHFFHRRLRTSPLAGALRRKHAFHNPHRADSQSRRMGQNRPLRHLRRKWWLLRSRPADHTARRHSRRIRDSSGSPRSLRSKDRSPAPSAWDSVYPLS